MTHSETIVRPGTSPGSTAALRRQYGFGPAQFAGSADALYDRTRGDHYMHLADLRSYLEADQRLVDLYADPDGWTRKAILDVAASGKFSSDRTIAEYAADIWHVEPCPVS
jgi:glycogen phosphorylase